LGMKREHLLQPSNKEKENLSKLMVVPSFWMK
jgi:hypothetical protein